MEKLYPVNTYIMRMSCDKCGGNMEFVGGNMVLASNPPQYLHMCDKCKTTQLFRKQYPSITYEPVEQVSTDIDAMPIDFTMNTEDIEEIMNDDVKVE